MASMWMKLRLLRQCTDYWHEHNEEPCNYSVPDRDKQMEIYNFLGDKWTVANGNNVMTQGTWEECRNYFISNLKTPNDKSYLSIDDSNYYYDIEDMKNRYIK